MQVKMEMGSPWKVAFPNLAGLQVPWVQHVSGKGPRA